MISLVSVQDVKTRMGISDSMLGVDATITSCILSAQLRIESELDSKFDKQDKKNLFYLDQTYHNGIIHGGMFRLYLQSGLVVGESVKVYTVSGPTTSSTGGTLLGAEDFWVDAQKGIVYVHEKYASNYILVEYTSGYEAGATIPDWLKEAILSYVPVVFNFSQPHTKDTKALLSDSSSHALAILIPYRRNIGFTIRFSY